jgi:hypothetical protein
MSEQRWREDPGVWWPAPDQNNRAPDSFPYKNFPPPSAAPCVRGYPDYRGVPGRPDGSVAPPGWWPSYPGMDGGMTNAAQVVSFAVVLLAESKIYETVHVVATIIRPPSLTQSVFPCCFVGPSAAAVRDTRPDAAHLRRALARALRVRPMRHFSAADSRPF